MTGKIIIEALKGLESLVEPIKEQYELSIEERKSLGLALPENLFIKIQYHSEGSTLAYLCPTDGKSGIFLNALDLYSQYLPSKVKFKAYQLIDFIDKLELITDKNINESNLFEFLNAPRKILDKIESEVFNSELYQTNELFIGRKKIYIENRNEILAYADKAKSDIEECQKAFANTKKIKLSGIDVLRHELDHAVLYETPLKKRIEETANCIMDPVLKDYKTCEKSRNKLANLQMKILKLNSEFHPITEISALIFSYVKLNSWNRINYNKLKSKVESEFNNVYVQNEFNHMILMPVMLNYLPEAEFSLDTANYIYYHTQPAAMALFGNNYSFDEKNVDTKIADSIINRHFPRWQRKFIKNGSIVLENLIKVYSTNPAILGNIKSISSFKDFVELCKI